MRELDYSNFGFSVSYTTRKPRPKEVNGKDYFFVTKFQFLEMIEQNQFVEYCNVHENWYGTSKQQIKEMEKIPILDIDV